MKKLIAIGITLGFLIFGAAGCATTASTSPSFATKVAQVREAIEPVAAAVIRRVISRSPQHATEIAGYARAVALVFCQMKATSRFDVAYLVAGADAATAQYQASLTPDIVDAKNGAIALYKVFASDTLSVQLPDNVWLSTVCSLFCDSISQALKDSGQLGI